MIRVSIWIAFATFVMVINGCSMSKNNAQAVFCSETQVTGTCLVRSYKDSAAVYVTQQQHFFCPTSLGLKIISNEPQGKRVWSLNKSDFHVSGSGTQLDKTHLYTKNIMEAILFGMASSVELLPDMNKTSGEPIKVEGQWYIPYQISNKNAQIQLLQNKFNKRYELVLIKENDTCLLVHSYDYWYEKNIKKQIPRTIDIFDISRGIASKTLVKQVNYLLLVADMGR
jgi:hypothetical protein